MFLRNSLRRPVKECGGPKGFWMATSRDSRRGTTVSLPVVGSVWRTPLDNCWYAAAPASSLKSPVMSTSGLEAAPVAGRWGGNSGSQSAAPARSAAPPTSSAPPNPSDPSATATPSSWATARSKTPALSSRDTGPAWSKWVFITTTSRSCVATYSAPSPGAAAAPTRASRTQVTMRGRSASHPTDPASSGVSDNQNVPLPTAAYRPL
mmetsp:Transcript_3281/g.8874  ORF Transcript_3281/g.8874 Transcript_3281/m.8874 type:complete len:207 (-) Transcript_3281:413-1033(-)